MQSAIGVSIFKKQADRLALTHLMLAKLTTSALE